MSEPNAIYDPSIHQGLSQKAAQEAYDSFTKFDSNRNGSITLDEVKECLQRLSIEFEDTDVDRKFRKYMDLNADGKVSLDEYMKFMAAVHRHECEGFKIPVDHIKH